MEYTIDKVSKLAGVSKRTLRYYDEIGLLIENVEKTIHTMKGEENMSDQEKFKGFINKMVDENEQKYGAEIREKYGEDVIERSNEKVRLMTKENYDEIEALTKELNEALKEAFEKGDPESKEAQHVCELHKKWLCYYWTEYSKEAHVGLARMYVEDPRFSAYYDKIAKGSAVFLRDAIEIYVKKEGVL